MQLDCHLVQEKPHEGLIKIIHILSRFQITDILTKPIGSFNFHHLIRKMGMFNVHSHLEGGCWHIENHIEELELKSLEAKQKASSIHRW